MQVIRGRVAGTDGRPRAGVRVSFAAAPGLEPEIVALTDENGAFSLTARHTGEYQIAASDDAGRMVRKQVTVSSGPVPELQIEIDG